LGAQGCHFPPYAGKEGQSLGGSNTLLSDPVVPLALKQDTRYQGFTVTGRLPLEWFVTPRSIERFEPGGLVFGQSAVS
jgi:hypothetical protein